MLAGLADAAKTSGVDLYTAAKNLTNALFDPYGAPILSTGTVPTEVSKLQAAVKNYTASGTISAANVPASDPYAVIGVVNPALATGSTILNYYHMQVAMDSYTAGVGQSVDVNLGIESFTADLATGTGSAKEFAYFFNGKYPGGAYGSGAAKVNMDSYGQLIVNNATTVNFSKGGEFGVGEQVGVAQAALLDFFVKKPTVAPTLASVAGKYHIVLMGHDSSMAPTAMAGYTESGTLTLDGKGNTSYVATNTDITTGMPVYTSIPISGVNVNQYNVDPYGVVLNTNKNSNGHLILSANGQYGLYELHGPGTQEWGIVIKDHKNTIPFSSMTKAIAYDVHAQGTNMGVDFHKALNVRKVTPSVAANTNIDWVSLKTFAPVQLAPAIMCGTANTAACTQTIPIKFYPTAPNTTQAAVNGYYEVMDVNAIGTGLKNFKSYVSSDGGVFWTDDGEASSVVIGIGR